MGMRVDEESIIAFIYAWLCLFYDDLIGLRGRVHFPSAARRKETKKIARKSAQQIEIWRKEDPGRRGGEGVFRVYPQPYRGYSIII